MKIGAHPGLADREGFGRREIKMTRDEIAALVLYQVGALKAFLDAEQADLTHIKPHGALMGMAQTQEEIAERNRRRRRGFASAGDCDRQLRAR